MDVTLAIFDGDKGAAFTVLLVGLLVVGTAALVANLSRKPSPGPRPKWEPVAEPAPGPEGAPKRRRRGK